MPDPLDFDSITLDTPEPNPEPVGDSLGPDFLKNVAESDRPIVEKYIKDWDSGVTQKFQDIHSKYEPFKDYVDTPDSYQNALALYELARDSPEEFYKFVKEAAIEMELEDRNDPSDSQDSGSNLPEFEGVPEGFVKKYQAMESQLSEVSEYIKQDKASKESATQQQQLDKLLVDLHDTHGKFDDDAVLARVLKGMNPEDAIKDYNKVLNETLSSREKKTPPPVLNRGGTVSDQVDGEAMKDKKTRVGAISQLLAHARE